MSSSSAVRTSKYSYRSTQGGNADVSIEYSADLSALTRLEDKIRLLHDDLESERELRGRIEREKADLSVQVIQLSERLEEAEGGAESQFEINKKRDTELLKLRKLLEDVHIESEETASMLKRKHQEVVVDFQEQIDTMAKAKSRAEKEKAKFQSEVYELIAQVESATKERLVSVKHAEKLEVFISELNVRIEELNRTIVDITSHKTRLSQENIELTKEVQDIKVNLENAIYLKSQLASQLEDARRRAEDDERRRSILEASLHQIEIELESVRVQLEEESEARLDLERQLVKSQGEVQIWKSKYETEAIARAEEIEELRRKYTVRITEQEEHIESLLVKVNNLEKQKSRLQSEVEVLIIDLEKANGTARELQKRVEHLERVNLDLKTRLDETLAMYEQGQRDLRNKQQEIQRLNHELDKTREQRDALARDNKKMADDLHDARNTITEYTRRMHEMEIELRRLENEREELTAAYKEAEAGRKAEEQRSQRLASELNLFRHEAEKRLHEKDEEIEAIRKATSIEIEQLNARVVEAETKLKSEVARIKKKLQIQITELEMSLDSANKINIDLQKTIKKQSFQLTELTAHYDEVQRQLQVTLDQLSVCQRRIQALTAETEEIRGNYEAALRGKKAVELQYEESVSRINELTVINVNLASTKCKIEQELSTIVADYEEITKELRISDERYQRVQAEIKHTVEILHEEQERVVKIEAIKKSLEIEVKNLSVRLEEVEANAIVGGKRIISKLEARIRDMECELDEEKRRHAETIKILRKKERTVKEVMIQCEEDQKNIQLLQESLDKTCQKVMVFKRQLQEQEGVSQQSVTRVRRFQRELEAAEDRADTAESSLSLIRAKHRTFVTTSSVPGSQVYLVQETRTSSSEQM
ncbi:PREDICTED: paramyosin, long form-like [Nicrophorus vespilloides]|uniref:Paramyosin n=1 Tax=Nicrophorus vespilloides TaxID=110193 RepID=A0ABM1M3F3_NICVS|nr:PREDICTED: paramyosin, long form-like [Nicrophorus vespilloides]XP_017769104.1 PREDICTED: paramyosin, long form-like [Nicrophorus vespilloides]XP_017769105.1 PREDICTED: paramyosin, long form-like [Nicrophorus vespilloides]